MEPHDHGRSHGVLTVVDGTLTEIRWHGSLRRTRLVSRGDLVAFGAGAVHDVVATGDTPAASVHLYSPPLSEMRFYDPTASR